MERMLPALPPPGLGSMLPPEEPLALGPGWDGDDYRAAEKPHPSDVKHAADELMADHSLRIGQSREYSHFLDTHDPGYFKEDKDLIEADIIEKMPLLGEREAYEFRCGWLAMHDPYPRLLNRDSLETDEAIAIEDLVSYDFQQEARQYARAHGADLSMAEAAHIQRYGALVGLDVLDPTNPAVGLDMRLIDPLTVFPVWGGPAGLVEVYRVFQATNEEIIGAYGGKPGSAEYERIERKVKRSATKTKRGRRNVMMHHELRTVIECWNRDHQLVLLDEDIDLVEVKHGYRRLPFTIRLGAFDQPAGVSIGSSLRNGEPYVENSSWGVDGKVTVSGRSIDIARQWRPPGWRHVWAHRIAEAVAGRRLSMFKGSFNPHVVREYDPSMEWKLGEKPDISIPGEVTDVPLPGRINVITPVADPNVMAGLAADLQSNTGSGYLNQVRMGAIPPQTSGSAMSKLATLGGAAEVGLLKAWQGFKRDRAEWRLTLRMEFGDGIGEPLGMFRFAGRQQGGRTPVHEVTPAMLRRSGTEVDIEGHMWEPDVGLAQYLTTLRAPSPVTGEPLISDETARRKLKATPDVDRERHRIRDEAISALPPVKQQSDIIRLEEELEAAQEAGDEEDVERLMIAIAELEYLHDLAIASGQASPVGQNGAGGGGMGMGSPVPAPAPPAGGGGTPALPGTSLPEQGIGVGTQGGRPTGSTRPAMTPIGGPRNTGRGF